MPKKPKAKTIVRTRQRAHAKLRFHQRFELNLNRDQIHEIEKKIAGGQAFCIEAKKRNLKNFFIEVSGKLIAVGYNNNTNRVVTALPDDYVAELQPETVVTARLLLFRNEAEAVIADIKAGKAEKLYQSSKRLAYYAVQFNGLMVRIGYSTTTKKLVPFKERTITPQSAVRTDRAWAHAQVSPILNLDPAMVDNFKQQIHTGRSRSLWRFSETLKFYEVQWNGQPYRVGYSNRHDVFHAYVEPPEELVELRSFLRLLEQPPATIKAVLDLVRDGKAELVEIVGEHNRAYRVEHGGDVYWLVHCDLNDRIEPRRNRRRKGSQPQLEE